MELSGQERRCRSKPPSTVSTLPRRPSDSEHSPFLVIGDGSSGSVAVFELSARRGAAYSAPAHSHILDEETIYGVGGVLTWTVLGKPNDGCQARGCAFLGGAVHRLDNVGKSGCQGVMHGHTSGRRSPFPASAPACCQLRPVVRRIRRK